MQAGSCLRGYFFGLQETLVPAINQVFEQLVRMTVIFLLAGLFIPMGLEYACALAIIGIVAEEIFSLAYVLIAFKRSPFTKKALKKPSLTQVGSLAIILSMALPLTGNRVTGSLISAYENILLPQRLQLYGMTASEAMQAFGQISGMVMPLIFFPSAFLVSLSISLVPAVSEASAVKNYRRISYTVSKSVLFASVIGFGAACLFVTFPGELGDVIYNQDIRQMLLLLGVMCPFLYMQTVLSGVLNGLGYQLFLFRNSLISSAIVIGFVYFLVPIYGIYAFILGWFLSLIVVCTLEINKILSNVDITFEFTKWFLKPILSAVCTGLIFKYIANSILFDCFGRVGGLVVASFALLVVYLVFIMLTGCLSFEDMKNIITSIKPKKSPDTVKEDI